MASPFGRRTRVSVMTTFSPAVSPTCQTLVNRDTTETCNYPSLVLDGLDPLCQHE
jgi:hypothetical protein